jgi:hypothetical protein
MLIRTLFAVLPLLAVVASGAHADLKVYDRSINNGLPGDLIGSSPETCPPVQVTAGNIQGYTNLEDDGLGTVTLLEHVNALRVLTDFTGPGNDLVSLFGPGAFYFRTSENIFSTSSPQVSNSSGIGAHGPSATAPGGSVEWGVVSSWEATGTSFCISSPVTTCQGVAGAHGVTIPAFLPSATYDLGTWAFGTEGDFEAETPYIHLTVNGGTSNTRYQLRGAFVGASLPALPLVGFGALAVGLAVTGGRALRRR